MLPQLYSDARLALRRLKSRPISVGCAVATLAVAIVGPISLFGLVDQTLLRPIIIRNQQQIFTLQHSALVQGQARSRVWMNLNELRRGLSLPISGDLSVSTVDSDPLVRQVSIQRARDAATEVVPVRFVSHTFVPVLGLKLESGRSFDRDDDRNGADPVTIVSYRLWQAWFQRDVLRVGSASLQVNGVKTVVVGVFDRAFRGLTFIDRPPDLLLPLNTVSHFFKGTPSPEQSEQSEFSPATQFQLLWRATRPPGVQPVSITSVMRADRWSAVRLVDVVMPPDGRYHLRQFLSLLSAVALLALLVGCLNVSSWLHSDVQSRRPELALRAALGARPLNIVSLIAADGVVLVLASGGVAYLIAKSLTGWVSEFILPGNISISSLQLNAGRAVGFTAALCVLVSAVVLMLPLVRAMRPRIFMDAHRRVTLGRLNAIAVIQAAAAAALVAYTAAFGRVVADTFKMDLGFSPSHLIGAAVSVPPSLREGLNNFDRVDAFVAGVVHLPGVSEAAVGSVPLVDGSDSSATSVSISGRALELVRPVDIVYASSDYLHVLRELGLKGRDFDSGDTFGSPRVAILNQAASALLFPSATTVIGSRFDLTNFGQFRTFTVIGTVPNVTLVTLGESGRPVIYLCRQQLKYYLAGRLSSSGRIHIMLRSRVALPELRAALDREAGSYGLSIESLSAVTPTIERMLLPQVMVRDMLLYLSAIAVTTAVIGVYASSLLRVNSTARDRAIRIALGATRARVAFELLRPVVAASGAGGALGGLLVWWTRGLMDAFALGQAPVTLELVFMAAGLITALGTAATLIAMRRMKNENPIVYLRA